MQIFARLSRTMFFAAIASLQPLAHAGQSGIVTAEMKAGESDQQFVQRIAKADLTKAGRDQSQIARTSKLLADKEVLLAFTTRPSPLDPSEADLEVTLNVFIKQNAQSYAYLEPIVACEVEGGSGDLRAFFYVNVAGEPRPLLGAICGWDEYHAAADCQSHDEVRLYKISESGILVMPMDKYHAALYSSDPTSDCTVSNFHTAADIKRLLSKFETKAHPHP